VCGLRPCRHGGLRLETEPLDEKRIVHHYGHGGCGVTIAFGTTECIKPMIQAEAEPGEHIAVLGAGVVGLVTARELAQSGYRVTVYADKVGTETTSVIAGAIWLPVGIEFGSTPEAIRERDEILHQAFARLKSLDPDRYGIESLDVYEPKGTQTEEGLFSPGLIEEPELIDSFPFPCDAAAERRFRTLYIHTPRFLNALIEDLRSLGVRIEQRRFGHHAQLQDLEQRILVNCLAMGSRELFGDSAIYPARGVLVHMKPQKLGYCVHDGYKYMFPREDALILGGCFQPDREDDRPDDEMVREILQHHRRFFGSACGVG
jgi:glycine/D-amino acid oxidase-like deaminating enzyme